MQSLDLLTPLSTVLTPVSGKAESSKSSLILIFFIQDYLGGFGKETAGLPSSRRVVVPMRSPARSVGGGLCALGRKEI